GAPLRAFEAARSAPAGSVPAPAAPRFHSTARWTSLRLGLWGRGEGGKGMGRLTARLRSCSSAPVWSPFRWFPRRAPPRGGTPTPSSMPVPREGTPAGWVSDGGGSDGGSWSVAEQVVEQQPACARAFAG